MKKNFYLLIFVFLLITCNQIGSTVYCQKEGSVTTKISSETLKNVDNTSLVAAKTFTNDSLIVFNESLFMDMGLDLKEISEENFLEYKKQYTTECALDSGNFIFGSGIYISLECDGISVCEKYLVEKSSNRKIYLPTTFDRVVQGVFLSPSCDKLIFYSTYDGPDYNNYYDHRAEIFIMSVNIDNGLKGIQPFYKYYTNDWSIEDLIWLNNNSIAIKIYEEGRWGDGSEVKYNYYKATIKKKNK